MSADPAHHRSLRRFYTPELVAGQTIELRDSEAHHLIHVLRAQVGDRVELFDGRDHQAQAEIVSLSKRTVTLAFDEVVERSLELPRRVVVASAVPKGDRQQLLIEKLVEVGCHAFWPIQFQRSSVRADAKSTQKWNRYVIEASKQCGRNLLMEIGPPRTFRELVEVEWLTGEKWIANPLAERPLRTTSGQGDVLVAIGPEGGFAEEELAAASANLWHEGTLGRRILRLETAAIVAASLLGIGAE